MTPTKIEFSRVAEPSDEQFAPEVERALSEWFAARMDAELKALLSWPPAGTGTVTIDAIKPRRGCSECGGVVLHRTHCRHFYACA